MNFLVTGGAGFIGSNLVDLLVSNGHKVTIIDDLSTGKISNISHHKSVEFINKKVQKYSFDKMNKFNGIFHLAAQASVPLSIQDFYKSSLNNIDSSIKIIEFAKNKNLPFVYASTSALYGSLEFGSEKSNVVSIESPYAMDKYFLEKYCNLFNKISKMKSSGLRLFNVYGPRQDSSNPYSGVISIFIDRILSKKSIVINGGNQTRDFIFVGDVVNIFYQTMIKLISGINFDIKNFNVCTGKSISIINLAEILFQILNTRSEIIYKEIQFGDPHKSEGDFKFLLNNFPEDFKNFLNLDNGLRITVDSFKSKL